MATHLVGGFISYEYVGTSSFGARYTITITSYRDCKTGAIPYAKNIDVCVYQRSDQKLYKTFNFTLQSTELVKPVGRTDCPEATGARVAGDGSWAWATRADEYPAMVAQGMSLPQYFRGLSCGRRVGRAPGN